MLLTFESLTSNVVILDTNVSLRDFHSEAKEVLILKDPTFHPSYMTCWKESLPEDTPAVQVPLPHKQKHQWFSNNMC